MGDKDNLETYFLLTTRVVTWVIKITWKHIFWYIFIISQTCFLYGVNIVFINDILSNEMLILERLSLLGVFKFQLQNEK